MKKIPLTKGYEAIVDDEDFERVNRFKWLANVTPAGAVYARRSVKSKGKSTQIYLHRFIVGARPDQDVDHDNGDTLDCRRENLKPGTTAENLWNIHSPPRGAIPLRGVRLNRHGFASASIRANGRQFNLGSFETPELAAAAYERAARLRREGKIAEIGRDPTARKQRRPYSLKKAASR